MLRLLDIFSCDEGKKVIIYMSIDLQTRQWPLTSLLAITGGNYIVNE
jgi:hypothetical protein